MSIALALTIGIMLGVLLAGVALALVAARMRAALVQQIAARVGPVLERRAVTLGLALEGGASVGVDGDGELSVEQRDELARLLALADAIDAHEHAQLGYLDTMRVAKDDVDASLVRETGERVKSKG